MSLKYEDKLLVLQFYDKHGMEAALDLAKARGHKLKQSTLYDWLAVRREARSSNASESIALNPKSTRPKKFKSSKIPSVFSTFIKSYRKKRFGVGKEKLAAIINKCCESLSYAMEIKAEYGVNLYGLPKISPSSVGRIIDTLKKSGGIVRNAKEWNKQKLVYLDGGTGTIKSRKQKDKNSLYGKKKNRKPKDYKPSQIGDLIQLDAVTINVRVMHPITGVVTIRKVYFVCGIDTVSRLA
jgi:hypothetical protein